VIEEAARRLRRARRVVAFSGAGISAESGVPTFRDAGGLWEKHRIEDVATPRALRGNPRMVWEFYEMRRRSMLSVEPNAGHRAVAELETLFEDVTVVTQNIDGLHQRAGSTRVLEVHGSLWRAGCLERCGRTVDPFPFPAPELPPPCGCGSILRPEVVLFGEMLPEDVFREAEELAARADVVLVIGTSSIVWPAAGIPLAAQSVGATVVEVNPERTDLTDRFDLSLRGRAGEILPQLVARVRELQGAA
jgi:NAD-dependent deacetylase